MAFSFINNAELALSVIHEAGAWLAEKGRVLGSWADHVVSEPDEFFVGVVNGKSAVAAVLKFEPLEFEWALVDSKPVAATYVYWLSVARSFAGQGYVEAMLNFADKHGRENGSDRLRLSVENGEPKLREVYERLDFQLVADIQSETGITALYERLTDRNRV